MSTSVAGGAAAVCTDCLLRWKTQIRSPWSKLIASALDELGKNRLPLKGRARASAKQLVHRPLTVVRQARNLHGVK